MRGHRQGMMVHGIHDMGTAVPLYDYSGLGIDLGAEMALYDFSGAHDMGGVVQDTIGQVQDYYAGLPGWVKGTVTVAGVLAVLGLATGKIKTQALNPLAKKKRNTRRRRRKNPGHAARMNRRNRSTRRRRRR